MLATTVDAFARAGNCGNGPNIIMMPEEMRMRHVCTPADVLGVLQSINVDIAPSVLQATEVCHLEACIH